MSRRAAPGATRPAPRAARATPATLAIGALALAVAALVVLPLFFALLAPPTLASGHGASLSAASRDLSTAALDRLERLLSGEFTVRLAGLDTAHVWTQGPSSAARAIHASGPLLPLCAHPSETARTL